MTLYTRSRAIAFATRPSSSIIPQKPSFPQTLLRNASLTVGLLRVIAAPSFQLGVPSILAGLWDSILRAVPKKKTSHRKKRQRFLAGKALKDVTHLNRCPACGNTKRAHLLCPYCVREIKDIWQGRDVTGKKPAATYGSVSSQ